MQVVFSYEEWKRMEQAIGNISYSLQNFSTDGYDLPSCAEEIKERGKLSLSHAQCLWQAVVSLQDIKEVMKIQ